MTYQFNKVYDPKTGQLKPRPAAYTIVTRHRYRRTARAVEKVLERVKPGNQYSVKEAKRGPHRYYVVKLYRRPTV